MNMRIEFEGDPSFEVPPRRARRLSIQAGRATRDVPATQRRSCMPTEQHRASILTIDVPGRRRWLLWGERTHEFHLQPFLPSPKGGAETLCGRPVEPDSRSVIAPDTYICRDCVEAARAQARNR
jgi:hypothetical protein